ncbi:chondroitinase-B domain-containing protein [Membranihabitans marinus]|uniref:chondroitinase-B domain-containing protein n=1 Tax=Membranihabitans marinus TaxID=1227546 RepID=UPI001F3F42BE|nr:chondroitinase-B domain-containing protein [Membranihabitans marinus]
MTILTSCLTQSDGILVKDMAAFKAATENLSPGDKVILANGIWENAELVFKGIGTEDNPIVLTVEDKGKVFLEGESNLQISGEYIHVEGLVFRNGHTPTGAVVEYRTSSKDFCNNCRMTEIVIDDYNPSERFESDYWVALYGKNNRFDHSYLVGKRNNGVTLAVRLTTPESRENFHRIDHNYFGYHPILGSNGGETLRIGTSHHSLTNSNTLVEDNYFERCNGEHEIISNKSCQNTFRNNTFFECQGTLTMRHGNETLVDNNYFFGNRKANTGGIRIINEKQTVINNYCEGLTGYRFRGALVIMNGVPNSPINRYFQVKDSKAANNIFVDCDYIQFCAGSDEERSATPENTTFTNNLIYNENKDDVFTVYDDISGIDFDGNILSPNIQEPQNNGQLIKDGFTKETISFSTKNGLQLPASTTSIGPAMESERPSSDNTGVSWYPKKDYTINFNYGEKIDVEPGKNSLYNAIKNSKSGDIIVLENGEEYHMTKSIDINHPITVTSSLEGDKPTITFEKSSLFNIENGGALSLKGLLISGIKSDDYSGNNVVRTSRYSMINNYKFFAEDCDFIDLDVNHSFNVLRVFKNTFADSIKLVNCNFKNISGHVLNMDKETDDIGIYNVENVFVKDCHFENVGGAAIHLYRGGRDESTFGPILDLNNSSFKNVGHDIRNKVDAAVSIHGVQLAEMNGLSFEDSKKLNLHLVVGDPVIAVKNTSFKNSEGISSNDPAYTAENIKTVEK